VPAITLTSVFLLVIGVPLLVIIFGNIYCGYICPFGAAQELLGYVLPEKYKQQISNESMLKARFIKYAVLLILIIVFFTCRDRTTLAADPLISVFNLRFSNYDFQTKTFLIAATALIGSIFYGRFWCRYLCPAGAFLSLLNHIAILKRYLPVKRFGKCEFGLTAKDKMDCIQCDRCRYIKAVPKVTREQKYKGVQVLIPYAIAIAIFISAVSINRFLEVIPAGQDYSAVLAPSGGQPRNVDIQRVRTMIEQKKLSDKEAEFYKKLE
jgi:polyferredoxin